MANFNIPFGRDAERRVPTSDERQNGFPCGDLSQALFNGLFHRIESELGEVISGAGLTPTDTDFTQLRQAIQALIDASIGSGDTENFLLLSQASSRLPIFPEMLTSDGRINVTSPATGTIRLPGGISFMHRGISPLVTVQTDFVTTVNNIYHLRWSVSDGFQLRSLNDNSYNPAGLPETHQVFDTTYDDMLISRVITNSSNVATITNLANLPVLTDRDFIQGDDIRSPGVNAANFRFQRNWNWARTPKHISNEITNRVNFGSIDDFDQVFYQTDNPAAEVDHEQPPTFGDDRYGMNFRILADFSTILWVNFSAEA